MKSKIIVIIGPTSSGKSELGVWLAKKIKGEIISADSRQVYRGLNIGTGKITKREMKGIPHHLLDVADPQRQYNVSEFKKDAEKAIRSILQKNKVPVIVGGTGFYVDAIVKNISLPEVPPNKKLRLSLEKKSSEVLMKMLRTLDPKRAGNIDPNNKRRIIRAIEISKYLGKNPLLKSAPHYESHVIGITIPKEELRKRIEKRADVRIKKGMITEARNLKRTGLSYKRMRELGLEYKFLADHLEGKISKKEFTERLKTAIWQYARRQMTWFKRDKNINWFSPNDRKLILSAVKNFLA